MGQEEQRQFVFERMKDIVEHAWENVQFYRHYYEQCGFQPSQLRSFDDLSQIPMVNKSMLQQWDLEKRSCPVAGRYLVNTGGSSGSTLPFYILPSAIGHDWAHTHHAWTHIDYKPSDLKLGFAGWWYMGKRPFQYDGLRHQFAMNIFSDHRYVAKCLKPVLRKHRVHYLHGYPSAIYDFACYCDQSDRELRDMLRDTLRGVILASEFPVRPYREMIESVFDVCTLSFYGHTERAILATEKGDPYDFYPLQTYGFAEAVADSDKGVCKLIGTSYYNRASPFIRYDTSDEISVKNETGGILRAFRIEAGRKGDYILDRHGKRIALTGLIFGRHHKVFNHAKFVQIAQLDLGHATIYVTMDESSSLPKTFEEQFDTSGVDISFTYRRLASPIISPMGKVLLKVPLRPEDE